jgi:hypothetical protein
MEALTFLVNNLGSGDYGTAHGSGSGEASLNDIDFKSLRAAFRELDTENLGMLSMQEVK